MSIKSCLDFTIVNKFGPSSLLVNDQFKNLKIILKYFFDAENSTEDIQHRLNNLNSVCAHKYIVKYESSFTVGNVLYLIFQHCEGGSLKDLINRVIQYEDVLHESEIMDWFCQLVIALNHLNENGISLTYINPRKILLKDNCVELSITEFILKHLHDKNVRKFDCLNGVNINSHVSGNDNEDDESEKNVQRYQEIHLSPEQLYTEENFDDFDKSSSWSLGCILYELCSKKKLFQSKVDVIHFKENLEDFNKYISICSEEIPADIRDIFLRVMKYDRNERLPTSEILKEDVIKDYVKHRLTDTTKGSGPEGDLYFETSPWKCNETIQLTSKGEASCNDLLTTYGSNYTDNVDEDFLTTDDITEIINSL